MRDHFGAVESSHLDPRCVQLVRTTASYPVSLILKVICRFLLLASAITMGGIGIWGMHFVGNRAVLLEHGVSGRQILYNPAYTTLSFFLPIMVLLAAFYMLGI